ncbi:MAG TPA: lipoyl synthase [Bacteroidetes bacterium]|nr:lipoyl synthase [Bacteroidota bacterium]
MEQNDSGKRRLPPWLKMKMPKGESYSRVKNLVQKYGLHTICTSGNCPNIGECWGAGTATFMILGDICTRNCKYCGVKTGKPAPPDRDEPLRVAESVRIMKLRHCVLTSVDRDDLPDRGAGFWAYTIGKIKEINPNTTIEALIPDFDGLPRNLGLILAAAPEVISHNLETVRRLTPIIRSRARYERSLQVLKYLAENKAVTKSGIMLGLGERREEVLETMDDLLSVGCRILTIGQYLAPTLRHIPVAEYFPTEVFREYERIGLEKGFRFVESNPLVRSSYHAEKHVENKE